MSDREEEDDDRGNNNNNNDNDDKDDIDDKDDNDDKENNKDNMSNANNANNSDNNNDTDGDGGVDGDVDKSDNGKGKNKKAGANEEDEEEDEEKEGKKGKEEENKHNDEDDDDDDDDDDDNDDDNDEEEDEGETGKDKSKSKKGKSAGSKKSSSKSEMSKSGPSNSKSRSKKQGKQVQQKAFAPNQDGESTAIYTDFDEDAEDLETRVPPAGRQFVAHTPPKMGEGNGEREGEEQFDLLKELSPRFQIIVDPDDDIENHNNNNSNNSNKSNSSSKSNSNINRNREERGDRKQYKESKDDSNVAAADLVKTNNLVSEYLEYQGYKHSLKQFQKDLSEYEGKALVDEHAQVPSFFSRAMQTGDYPGILNLWDIYVVPMLTTIGHEEIPNILKAEFQMHIYMAIYPFKLDVVKTFRDPRMAGDMASRSMTIFRHFIETRGFHALQLHKTFNTYKSLHKIAFPPTHPNYKHLFSTDWQFQVVKAVDELILKIFPVKSVPKLVKLVKLRAGGYENILKMAEKRENKLIGLTQTLYEVSNDLLGSIERGKPLPKSVTVSLREKFSNLKEVIDETKASNSYNNPR